MASGWREKRAEFSEQFDADCYELARELIAIQRRELQELLKKPAGSLSVTALNKMALAARKSQELGRMALVVRSREEAEVGLTAGVVKGRMVDAKIVR